MEALSGGIANGHVCPNCGEPQPVRAGEDYFAALGAEPRFALDRAALEKRFYEISRALHPDRFTAAGPDAKARSLERMSFVNQAYQALKSPEALRDYVIARAGIQAPKAQIPTELAEDWFEIQDKLMEEPDIARALLSGFEEKLREVSAKKESELKSLEAGLDQNGFENPRIERLAQAVQAQAYLKSLARDIERIKARFGGRPA